MSTNQTKQTRTRRKINGGGSMNGLKRQNEHEIRAKAAIAAMAAMISHQNSMKWTAKEIAADAVIHADELVREMRRTSLR